MKRMIPILMIGAAGLLTWPAPSGATDAAAKRPVDPVGVYRLVEVNGSKLPATVSHGAELLILSGTFTITAEKTCTSFIRLRVPSGEDVSKKVAAVYTLQGKKLIMKWEGAGITEGTVEGDTFTMVNEGMVFTYQRQRETPAEMDS